MIHALDYLTPQTILLSPGGFDPRWPGVGSGPQSGMSSFGLRVPPFQPESDEPGDLTRYLMRLIAVRVPSHGYCRVRGLNPYVQIGETLPIEATESLSACRYPALLDVTTALWSFPDGNVSFHLRWLTGNPTMAGGDPTPTATWPRGVTSYSNDPYGSDAAILVKGAPPPDSGGPYVPLFAGIPPGAAVGSLTNVYEILPQPMDAMFEGPGTLALYASVRQSNSERRPMIPADTELDVSALCAEDRFVFAFRNAVYTRISAQLLCDMGPLVSRAFGPETPEPEQVKP